MIEFILGGWLLHKFFSHEHSHEEFRSPYNPWIQNVEVNQRPLTQYELDLINLMNGPRHD